VDCFLVYVDGGDIASLSDLQPEKHPSRKTPSTPNEFIGLTTKEFSDT
jgi:hypothetical protein